MKVSVKTIAKRELRVTVLVASSAKYKYEETVQFVVECLDLFGSHI